MVLRSGNLRRGHGCRPTSNLLLTEPSTDGGSASHESKEHSGVCRGDMAGDCSLLLVFIRRRVPTSNSRRLGHDGG